MKKVACLFAALAVFTLLCANPLVPMVVARTWFDANGDFNVNFSEEGGYYDIPSLTFSTSSGTWGFPAGFTPPSPLPYTINFSQTIPGFSINPNDDYFTVHTDFPDEYVHWSTLDNVSVHLHPLTPGQSAVQVRLSVWDGWEMYASYHTWAKDLGYIGGNFPSEHYTLNVFVTDTEGTPMPNYPLWISYTNDNPINYPSSSTGVNGIYSMESYACRTLVRVVDQVTNQIVLDEMLYPEPDGIYDLYAVVSTVDNSDPTLVPPRAVLEVYPNVLGPSSSDRITVKYGSVQDVSIKLYDLRGRVIAQYELPVLGEMQIDLPRLSSGIYFVGATSNGRALGRQKLTVIK